MDVSDAQLSQRRVAGAASIAARRSLPSACVDCGAPVAPMHKRCPTHKEARKEWYRRNEPTSRPCVDCGATTATNRKRCERCSEAEAIARRKRRTEQRSVYVPTAACLDCGLPFTKTGYAHKRCTACAKIRTRRMLAAGPIIGDSVSCARCGAAYIHRNGKKGACDECVRVDRLKRTALHVKKHKQRLMATPEGLASIRAKGRAARALARARHRDRFNAQKREYNKRRKESQPPRPWSLGRIRQELATLRNRLSRAERLWQHHTKPWVVAGFNSLREWAKGSDAGREWQRIQWQVRSKGHRPTIRRKMKDAGTFTHAEWISVMKAFGYRCVYCQRHRREFRCPARREDLEMDHVIPLGHEGFEHSARNIVPACKSCNASKSNDDLLSWLYQNGHNADPRVIQMFEQLGGVI